MPDKLWSQMSEVKNIHHALPKTKSNRSNYGKVDISKAISMGTAQIIAGLFLGDIRWA